MKFAICNEQFEGWDFERVCQYVKSVGYDGLEVAPFTLAPRITDVDKARRAELRRQADGAGVQNHRPALAAGGHRGVLPDLARRGRARAHRAVSRRSRRGDAGLRRRPDGVRIAEAAVAARRRRPGEQAFDYATDTFRRAMPGIAAHGVSLCMEPLGPSETDFINTAEEGARLMEAVGHPNFVLHLDVKAMSSEPTPIPDIIRQYAQPHRPLPRQRSEPPRPGLRRRGLRADLSGAEGFRVRPVGVGRGVRLHARPGNDRREEHRIHARLRAAVVATSDAGRYRTAGGIHRRSGDKEIRSFQDNSDLLASCKDAP